MNFAIIKNKLLSKPLTNQGCFDGFVNGAISGWLTKPFKSLHLDIDTIIERLDVKENAGIEGFGFQFLMDGAELKKEWLKKDSLTFTVKTSNNGIVFSKLISIDEVVSSIEIYEKISVEKVKTIIEASPLWDSAYYINKYSAEINKAITAPIINYIYQGNSSQTSPSKYFTNEFYLKQLTSLNDVVNPLFDYLVSGEEQGLLPNEFIDQEILKESKFNISQLLASGLLSDNDKSLSKENEITTGHCDIALLANNKLFISGWLVNKDVEKIQINITTTGKKLATSYSVIRFERQDVNNAFKDLDITLESGFLATFELNESVEPDAKLQLRIVYQEQIIQLPIENIDDAFLDIATASAQVLGNWDASIINHQINSGPVIHEFLKELYVNNSSPIVKKYTFGREIENPVTTLIVPLYGRYDFMRYQISNFSRFKTLENRELIYIVDDPAIAKNVLAIARELEVIFDVSFSVLILDINIGYGPANNMAVGYAKGNNILLLNSDVLPKDGDFLNKLELKLETSDDIGIVGCRLLYEDDSIQHDGMQPYTLSEYPNIILNDHPKKGWPTSLVHSKSEAIPLLTAACVLMKKSLFVKLNGFDTDYILGDFEDSDLCLRALELGYKNYICRDVVLNHLERQSQNLIKNDGWKFKMTLLNALTFSQKWRVKLTVLYPEILKDQNNA
jgi:GT2 family glycosyltransferase